MTCVEFFRRVLRFALTVGQTAFVSVAVDGRLPRELEGAVRAAALEMFGDLDSLSALSRRTVLAVLGRDSGKTQLSAGIGLYKLVTVDLARLGPGDVGTVGLVAPREKTARIALRRAIAFVNRAPELRKRLVGEPKKDGFSLRRPDGQVVTFEVFAASRGGASLRGPSWIAVIFDEAAQFRDESAAVNDAELYAAVMPRLLPGGLVLFASTPWASEGLFYKLANDNHGAPGNALVAIASTLLMRDHREDLQVSIDAELERDADNATREFTLAGIESFMSLGSSLFFEPQAITDAIDDSLLLPAAMLVGETVGFGADVGLVQDSSALVGVGSRARLLRVVSVREHRPEKHRPLKLGAVVADFATELRRYRATSFVADGHAREPAREAAALHHVSILARPEGPSAKFDTHVAVREALRDRRLALPRHPRLLAQLRAMTARPVAGGGWKISSPRRAGQGHGDIASALILAVWTAQRSIGRRYHSATVPGRGEQIATGLAHSGSYSSAVVGGFGGDDEFADEDRAAGRTWPT